MAGLVNAGKNIMLDALGVQADFASLHTADPGTGGASELSGGSPAYARKALAWAAAATASMSSSGQLVFDVPASTITHLGYWTAASGGTFLGSRPLDQPQVFATQGTYTVAIGGVTETLT